jgi:predicted Fe-Mo cluster-binding NifX family protein
VELLIAFGTDDGTNLNDNHFGMAKYFQVYKFFEKEKEFVEKRENVKFKGDESLKHGDPEKAKATSSVLQGIDVLVGKRFGPNLPRLVKKFVCVIVRTDALKNAIRIIQQNIEKIIEEKNKGENGKHLILK